MSSRRHVPRSSPLVGPALRVSLAFGSLLVILAAIGVPALPLALVGASLAILGGLGLQFRPARPADPGEHHAAPDLAGHPELERLHRVIGETLAAVAGQPDGNRKEAAVDKLVALGVQFRAVASGTGTLAGAESWHVAHDAVLGVPGLKEYRAVVRVRTAECVRDPAVQESLRAAYAAVRRGVFVERVLVLPEALWPAGRLLPVDDILPWIEDQHNHRLRTILLRDKDLAPGPDVPIDTCVFDDWAVGTRDLDDHSRTVRVALDFTPAAVRAALDLLDRLSNLGIPLRDLLDRAEVGG